MAVLSGVGGWPGAVADAELDPRLRNGALGFTGAVQDLPGYTAAGDVVSDTTLASGGALSVDAGGTFTAPGTVSAVGNVSLSADLGMNLAGVVSGGTTELLTDPGIESDGTWELQSGFTRTYAPVPVTVAHSGTYAIAKTLTGAASWDGPSQYAGLTAGVEYTFGAWLKGSGTVALRSQDTQNGWGDQFWQDVTLTDEWTYYFRTFTAPSNSIQRESVGTLPTLPTQTLCPRSGCQRDPITASTGAKLVCTRSWTRPRPSASCRWTRRSAGGR